MARRRAGRGAGRHARTAGRRYTPRRWLPFLALIALVGAALVISEQVSPSSTREVRVSSPQSLLPVAAVPDSVSATWFCGGGSATGEGEGADLSIVIANAGASGAEALVTFYGTGEESASERVDVPVNGRVRVRARDVLPGDWTASTVEVFDGRPTVERRVEGDDGFDQAPCASAASDTWYLPSGSTLRGAVEHLFLFNPFPDATSVDVTFATDEGALSPQALTGVPIPARSLRVITIENPARRKEVAATVTTRTGRIVVDRLQTYDGSGDPVPGVGATPVDTQAPRGISSAPAIATPATRWFWPDARIVQGGRTQLAVLNPNEDDDAELELTIGFADPDLYEPVAPIRVSVPAGQEVVVDLTDDIEFLPGMELTLDLWSPDGVPVAAELVWHTGERETQELETGEDPEGESEEDPEGSEGGEATGAEGDGELTPEEQAEREEQAAIEAETEAGGGTETDDGEAAEETSEQGGEATTAEEEEHDHGVGEGPGFTIYAPGVAVTAGSPVASRSWFVAGTGASSAVTSEIVVANPSASAIQVTVEELVDGSRTEVTEAGVSVPAGGRVTLDLATLADPTSALVVAGPGPLVVSRTLWATEGRGTSIDIATPFPDQVVPLPAR